MITIAPRTLWLALAAGGAALALASLVLTSWLGLHPCHLCIFQRLLFMLIAALSLAALALAGPRSRWLSGGLVLGLAALGVVVASYQTWLQAQPPGSISCVGGQPGLIERLVEGLEGQGLEGQVLVRQVKLGVSCRVQVPVGRGVGSDSS